MTFDVFEYEGDPLVERNHEKKYHKIGSFVFERNNNRDNYYESIDITRVMLNKIYGFHGNFLNGWSIEWLAGQNNKEGYVGSWYNRYWHIKRVA